MEVYDIIYTSAKSHKPDHVTITTQDHLKDGSPVDSLKAALEYFEEIAIKNWHTYETQHTITSINITEA